MKLDDKGHVLNMKLKEKARQALAATGKLFAQVETPFERDGTRGKRIQFPEGRRRSDAG